MRKYRLFSIAITVIALAGCGKPLPELENFDKKSWIQDPKGCLGKRSKMLDVVEAEKDKLLALDEMKIVALLGKPDANQLYKRNQKFYHYYIDASIACSEVPAYGKKLVVRFNAMGLANEVAIE